MTKFKTGDKVLYGDEERTIVVCRKNFSNQSIIYKLDTGEQVEEKDLKPIKSKLTRKKKKLVEPTQDEIKLQKRMDRVKEFEALFSKGDLENPELLQSIQEMSNKNFEKYIGTLKSKYAENAIEDE